MLPSVQKSRHKTYAQAAKAKTVSLLHAESSVPTPDETRYSRIIQTRIYRSARTAGAYLFNITACKNRYNDQQCMIELKNQHPNVHACVPLNDNNTRYLEVYITPDNDLNDIRQEGNVFSDANLKVIPCKAVDDQSQIVKLKLSHLPMLPEKEVLEGLQQSLAMFGNILDILILNDPVTGFFMGGGFAYIDVAQANAIAPERKYQELSHQISWMESPKEVFRATWNNMPTWSSKWTFQI